MSIKGFYNGIDARYNLFKFNACLEDIELIERIKEQSKSIACLVHRKFLFGTEEAGYKLPPATLTLSKFVKMYPNKCVAQANSEDLEGIRFGKQEAFRREPVWGSGTVFLIEKQHVLTAGHNICSKEGELYDIQAMRLIFGFQMLSDADCKSEFTRDDVYRIERVVSYRYNPFEDSNDEDWAILKLDRVVRGREPLHIDFSGDIQTGEKIYMLGHPTGLPLKLAYNGMVKKNDEKNSYFDADLAAFAGNSGSPVFIEKTGQVAALLFKGNPDYVIDKNYYNSGEKRIRAHCTSQEEIEQKGLEKCQKITSVLKSVLFPITEQSKYLTAIDLDPSCADYYNNLGRTLPAGGSIQLLNETRMTQQGLYLKAIDLDPSYADYYSNLGTALPAGGSIQLLNETKMNQQGFYLKAIDLDPSCATYYDNLGRTLPTGGSIQLLDKTKMTQQDLYLKAIDLDPSYADYYSNLGTALPAGGSIQLLDKTKMTQQGLYLKAIDLDSSCAIYYNNLGRTLPVGGSIQLLNKTRVSQQDLYLKTIHLSSGCGSYINPGRTLPVGGPIQFLSKATTLNYNGVDASYNMFEIEACSNNLALIERIKKQAGSIACLVDETFLKKNGEEWQLSNNVKTLSASIKNQSGVKFGEDEAFRDEPILANGTAFLIGKQHVLTAGRKVCSLVTGKLNKFQIKETKIVFGFQMLSESDHQRIFAKNDVYNIESVVAYSYREDDNWAILKLDRSVQGREPLNIDIFSHTPVKERVYTLGHPSGLPLKLNGNGRIRENGKGGSCFGIDLFGLIGGSPVFFEKTGLVAGWLCRGNPDYILDENYNNSDKKRVRVQSFCKGEIPYHGWEKCQKITTLPRSILNTVIECHPYFKPIDLEPKWTTAYTNLGTTLPPGESIKLLNGNSMTKQALHLKTIEFDPSCALAYANLAITLSSKESILLPTGISMKKQDLYLKAIELDSNLASAYNNLGVTLFSGGSIQLLNGTNMSKQDLYLKAAHLDPSCATYYHNLGLMLPKGWLSDYSIQLLDGTRMTRDELLQK